MSLGRRMFITLVIAALLVVFGLLVQAGKLSDLCENETLRTVCIR